MPLDSPPPARYEFRIEGHLDQHWSTWFGGLTVRHEADGTLGDATRRPGTGDAR